MKKFIFSLLFLSLFAVSQSASADAGVWALDKYHTNLYFTIDHIFAKVRGSFPEFTGELYFDPDNPAQSKLSFTVEVKSINTGIPQRNDHLKTAEFFDAEKYPEMKFVSTSFTSAGDSIYNVQGKFTVKGKEYDLVLPLKFEGIKDNPMAEGQQVIGFNGNVTIDRLAHGVGTGKYYTMGVVGKDVDVLVTIEALRSK